MVSTSLLALAKVPVRAEESARELRVEATVPQYGYSMGAGFGSLWMMSGDKVVRINVGDNSTTVLPIEGASGLFGFPSARSMAVGEGAIWVPDFDRGVIYKIDPQTNHVVKTIAADMVGGGGSIGAGLGAVWVITGGSNNELSRFSAESGAEEAKVPLPEAQPRSWPLARSGSRERETTNCIALIQPATRSLRRLNSTPDPVF